MAIINTVLVLTLIIVILLEGFHWIFTIWTSVPLLAAAALSELSLSPVGGEWKKAAPARRFAVLGMILGVVSLTLYFHLGFFLASRVEEAEQVTERITYLLAPFYALAGGGIGYALGSLLGRRADPDGAQTESSPDSADEDQQSGRSR